jgi:hypothetical protein
MKGCRGIDTCGCGRVAQALAFQASYAGSIPVIRSTARRPFSRRKNYGGVGGEGRRDVTALNQVIRMAWVRAARGTSQRRRHPGSPPQVGVPGSGPAGPRDLRRKHDW